MIDVKMIAKPKDGTSSGGTTTIVRKTTVESAKSADYAKKAGTAESAESAKTASSADLATRALYADKASGLTEDSEIYGYFLRKDTEDTAQEKITFEKGADFNGEANFNGEADFNAIANFLQGLTIGESGAYGITAEGVATLKKLIADVIQSTDITTDYLTVTKKAHFFELVIDKLKSAGGTVLLTAANCKADLVEAYDADGNAIEDGDAETAVSCWKVYWLAKDSDGNAVTNDWEAGDQALCYTCNFAEGTTYNASNRYWWRLVEAVGSAAEVKEINGEEVECHWIQVSNTTYDSYTDNSDDPESSARQLDSDAPEAGDNITLLGSRSDDTTRQNAIVLAASKWIDNGRAAYEDTDGTAHEAIEAIQCPAIIQYQEITSFSLADARYLVLAASGNVLKGKVEISTAGLVAYTHYAYCNDLTDDADFTRQSELEADASGLTEADFAYMGVVSDHTEGDSSLTKSDYVWTMVKGEGRGISSVTEYYAATTSGTTAPQTWFTAVQAMSEATPYLWNKEKITYTDGTSEETDPRVIGIYGKGEQGEQGDPGADGFSFSADQSALTFDMVTTDDGGYEVQWNGAALSASNCPTVTIHAYWGAEEAASIALASGASLTKKNCTASASYGTCVTLKVTAVDNTSVTVDSESVAVPYSSGYVSGSFTASNADGDTRDFDITIPFTVSGSYSTVIISVGVDSLKTQVSEIETDVDGVKTSYSAIEQKADSISLKVASQTLDSRRWNLLSDGYLNAAFYGSLGGKTLAKELTAGTTYTMTVQGMALNTSSRLVVYIYALDSSSNWTDTHTVVITSTTEATQTVTFEAAQSGVYYVYPYAYRRTSTVTGTSYTALLRWITVEEGGTSSGVYALSEDDLWAKPNLLGGTRDWTVGDYGSALATSVSDNAPVLNSEMKVKAESRKFVYVRNSPLTSTSGTVTTVDTAAFNGAVESSAAGALYTLSFWAKASVSGAAMIPAMLYSLTEGGTQTLVVYGVSDSEGNAACKASAFEGYTTVSLTTEWKKYSVTWWIPAAAAWLTPLVCRCQTSGASYYIAGVKLREGGRADAWTDYGEEAQTSAELASSITVTEDQIVLSSANTTFVDDSGKVVGVFTEDGLSVSELHTISDDGNTIDIENGTVVATGSNGTRFVFGMDSDGNAVLNYYGTDGTLKYSLGPDGLDASSTNGASWTRHTFYDVTDETLPSAGSTVTALSVAKVFFSDSPDLDKEYKWVYTAARTSGNIIADSTSGYTSAATAAAHDGKYHDSKYATSYSSGGYYFEGVARQNSSGVMERKIYTFSSGAMTLYRTFYCSVTLYNTVNGTSLVAFKGVDTDIEAE